MSFDPKPLSDFCRTHEQEIACLSTHTHVCNICRNKATGELHVTFGNVYGFKCTEGELPHIIGLLLTLPDKDHRRIAYEIANRPDHTPTYEEIMLAVEKFNKHLSTPINERISAAQARIKPIDIELDFSKIELKF